MSSASLVRDKTSNVKKSGFKKIGEVVEYEFTFPLRNGDLGDALWEIGKDYQIAVLVGPSEEFNGVTDDTWMSDQIHLRPGYQPKESIYHPPYLAEGEKTEHKHSHGGS